jgi:RNA polymerase sigma-70 factor (ECF subfamily)
MVDEFGGMPYVRIPIRLRRVVDADDLRQAGMLRFFRKGAKFLGRSDAERRAYLHRSLVSALVDVLRAEGRACRGGIRAAVVLEAVPADWTSPSRKAIRNERQARLIEAIAALPDDQRTAVTLYHLRGRTLAETAEAMGRTIPSAAGLIRRALATLRHRLADVAEV